MTSKTSPESPLPIRTVLQMVGGWIGKLGTVWVEGQITELSARGGTVFLTLRDPVANVSARVTAPRGVYEATVPRPADGARVVVHVKPDFWVNRGSFAFTALEIRPVGVGELLARLERLRQLLAAEGLFNADRKRRLPFLPGTIGLICGRDSAAERDVLENSRRRWPAVRFKVEQVAVQGPYAVGEVTEALRKLDADGDGRGDRHRPGRRLAGGPAAVLRRDAGARRGRLPHPRGERDRPRAGQPAARPGGRRARLHAHGRGQEGRARRRASSSRWSASSATGAAGW